MVRGVTTDFCSMLINLRFKYRLQNKVYVLVAQRGKPSLTLNDTGLLKMWGGLGTKVTYYIYNSF